MFFHTFPQNKKSAGLGRHSRSELGADFNPWTPAAYAGSMVLEEDELGMESEPEEDVVTRFTVGFRPMRDAVALWRLVEEFHIFSSCCSRCLLGIWTLFPRAPCIWQPLAPVRCDSPRRLLTNFFQFLREKWTPITLQFTLRNLELFLRAVSGSHRVRQTTFLWKNFTYFHRVGCPALENPDIIYTCSHVAVGRVFGCFDAFFALLQVVWS